MCSVSDDLRKFLANARGSAASARVLRLDDLVRLGPSPEVDADASPWGLAAMRGRLVEISARGATATLTTAAELVLEAQRAAEPVAWVVPWSLDSRTATFYPPDVAETGIDLAALVVVRAPSTIAAARAAERLLRSGAFGLVVLDFAASCSGDLEANRAQHLPDQVLGRLVSLAQSHDAAVICLTEKTSEAGSLGSLVSMRAEAMRLRQPGSSSETGFEVTIRALKDKRRGPGWSKRLKARGPAGMG
jgi:recombination protein RecA